MSFIYGKHGHNCNEVVTISGSFQPEGASAPTKVSGLGYTVAYTATGKYTITLTDKTLTKFIAGQCSLGVNDGAPSVGRVVNFQCTSGAIYDSANRQVTIAAFTSSTGAELALDQASDGSVICFTLHFSKSSLPAV